MRKNIVIQNIIVVFVEKEAEFMCKIYAIMSLSVLQMLRSLVAIVLRFLVKDCDHRAERYLDVAKVLLFFETTKF